MEKAGHAMIDHVGNNTTSSHQRSGTSTTSTRNSVMPKTRWVGLDSTLRRYGGYTTRHAAIDHVRNNNASLFIYVLRQCYHNKHHVLHIYCPPICNV
jgi:hypothetical protein